MTWEQFRADQAKQDAKMERLQAENAAMREIVEAVARRSIFTPFYPADGPDMIRCQWCRRTARYARAFTHADDCIVTKARALLQETS